MTTHQTISHTNRTALPRSLIARPRRVFRAIWAFRLGQVVDFYAEKALVVGRQRSARGRELYSIMTTCADRPFRQVQASALTASGAPPAHPIHAAFRQLAVDEYEFKFAIGQPVILVSTAETATIVGRSQVAGCVDQYVIEFADADREPLQLHDFQISAA